MPIYFYTPADSYGFFSNFSRHGIEMNGLWWTTVEHYFQAQKFAGTPYEMAIRMAKNPKQAAAMGRDRAHPLRDDWELVKDAIMFDAVRKKFTSHADLRALLLSTADEPIIENAPYDYYWGCGADGSGQNRLGQILMEVRDLLRS